MNEIIVIDKKFDLPKRFLGKKGFVVTQKWAKEVHRGRSIQVFFRNKTLGEKPYLKEDDIVKIKQVGGQEEIFRIIEHSTGELLDFVFEGAKGG